MQRTDPHGFSPRVVYTTGLVFPRLLDGAGPGAGAGGGGGRASPPPTTFGAACPIRPSPLGFAVHLHGITKAEASVRGMTLVWLALDP